MAKVVAFYYKKYYASARSENSSFWLFCVLEGEIFISNSENELLQLAASMNIIDIEGVREQVRMTRKEQILNEHGNSIWFNEKEQRWYCYLPDETQPNKRKRIRRKKRGDIEEIVFEFWLQKELQMQNKNQIVKADMRTVEELFYEFMEYKKNMVSSGTVKRMMADWERFYIPHSEFIHKPYKEVTKIDMDKFFAKVLDEQKLKKKAFYNMCGIIKQVMQYAEDAEYISKNPYRLKINKKKIEPTRKKKAIMEVYQGNEKQLIIQEMERRLQENPSNTAPLAVMLDFELGVRKGEIMALAASDIEGDRIHISKQLIEEFSVDDLKDIRSKGFKIADYTKTVDGDRWLPLTDRAIEIINRIITINEENGECYKDFLFVRNGYLMSPDTIDAQIKRGCEYIGIKVKTMHKIRKTYASTLLNNGVSLSIVKDMLGHADESTTLQHYIYNLETDDNTYDLVKNVLSGTMQNGDVQPQNAIKGIKRDQKIVDFQTKKKAETLEKSSISAS